jgi:hypothetical protein
MAEITVVVEPTGEAYVTLVAGPAPEVRDSVALEALDEANAIPALESLVLDFDGRLVGFRVTGGAHSVLTPRTIAAAPGRAFSRPGRHGRRRRG